MNQEKKYRNITLKDIEDITNILKGDENKSEKFQVTFYCKERGLITLDIINGDFCFNKECEQCSNFRKLISEEIKAKN